MAGGTPARRARAAPALDHSGQEPAPAGGGASRLSCSAKRKEGAGATRLSRALRGSRIPWIRFRARRTAVLLSRKPGPGGPQPDGALARVRRTKTGRLCAHSRVPGVDLPRRSRPQRRSGRRHPAGLAGRELPSGPWRGTGRRDPPPRPCADLQGETVMAVQSDGEYFARLVDALEPWLDQVVIIGGWAHRLYRLPPFFFCS